MKNNNKIKRFLSSISIFGFFAIAAVLVFAFVGSIKLNTVIVEILIAVAFICVGLIFALPWFDKMDTKLGKIFAIIFLSLIAVCVVLWIVCEILIVQVVLDGKGFPTAVYNLIRVSLIITIQFLVASTIASIVLRFKNTMIAFQVVTYLSYLYIDFWFTYVIACASIINGKFKFIGSDFIISKIILALLLLAFVYIGISSTVIKVNARRKIGRSMESGSDSDNDSPDERLKKLKNMLDNDLISKEEYEKKKEEILKRL